VYIAKADELCATFRIVVQLDSCLNGYRTVLAIDRVLRPSAGEHRRDTDDQRDDQTPPQDMGRES
jgi:hypothetical protein